MKIRSLIRVASVLMVVALLRGFAIAQEDPVRTHWAKTYEAQDRQAEASAGDSATINSAEQLKELAELQNAGLRAAFDRWSASMERVGQNTSLPDPKFSYAYFIESVETRVGPQRQKFGITQTIPLFGKLGLRGDVALFDAHAAGARFEQARLQLRFKMSQIWNDYYFLGRSLAVTEENLRLMSYLEAVALAQYTAGRAPHASVIRAQVELGRLEDRVRTLRDQQRPTVAALNAELNRPPSTPIAWPDSVDYASMPLPEEALSDSLLNNNPELAQLRFMVAKEDAATRLAGRSAIPDLTIGAEYIDTEKSAFAGVLDSGKDAIIAKATISIPLWFGQYKSEKSAAAMRRSAAERELIQLRNRLLAELESVQFELRDADRRIELYAFTLLPMARQSLEVAEDAFIAGDATFLDLIDAQRTQLEFQLAHERAMADRSTKYAHFTRLIGREFATEQKQGTER